MQNSLSPASFLPSGPLMLHLLRCFVRQPTRAQHYRRCVIGVQRSAGAGEGEGEGALTVSDVRRGEVVVDEKRRVFGHAEVNHVRRGLEGSHRLLVSHFLQAGGVHLRARSHTHTHAHTGTGISTHAGLWAALSHLRGPTVTVSLLLRINIMEKKKKEKKHK